MTGNPALSLPAASAPGAAPVGLEDAVAAAIASLPDPAVIARIANAFYQAVPGEPVAPTGPAAKALPANPAPGLPAGPTVYGSAPDLTAVVQSLGDVLGLVPHSLAAPATRPAAAPPQPAAPTAYGAPPNLSAVPWSFEGELALVPHGRSGVPAAAPTPTAPATPGAELYFLESLRTAAPQSVPATPRTPVPDGQSVDSQHRPELVPDLNLAGAPFDPHAVRRDFPILSERVHGKPLIWLDNAATTQKPQAVIDRLSYFYEHENSNIHRAAHTLAARATDAYEAARDKARRFLGAGSVNEIVFVRGATEAINLVAKAWGRRHVAAGDEIVVSWLEHHANIVPWQQLAAETGARLRVAPVDDRGQVILEEYEKLLGPRTRLVSFTQVSNALGTITPAREMVAIARRYGARVLVDGAQAVSHMPVNVQELDADFYVFSGHKVFGPTGIGVLWGREDLLNSMPPWQGGGNMIADVTFEKTVYQPAPARFEAGTGNIADAVGLGAALDYLERIGMATIARYEHELLAYATERLLTVPGLHIVGTAAEKAGVLSFVLDGCRSQDVGTALDGEGIAVRSGHHCAQPILRRFGLESTVRASLALYNTFEDIDALVATLLRLESEQRFRRPPIA